MSRIAYAGVLEAERCARCGVPFGLDTSYAQRRREDRETFYCPNGHEQWFPGQTAEQKIKQLEARVTHERDQRHAAERSASAQKGQVTKIKKRVAAGVCPCCQRSFVDLARHMAGQHPDYGATT